MCCKKSFTFIATASHEKSSLNKTFTEKVFTGTGNKNIPYKIVLYDLYISDLNGILTFRIIQGVLFTVVDWFTLKSSRN